MNLRNTRLVSLAVLLVLCSSCSSVLVSPLNTNSNPHIPLPVKGKDEENKTERYVGLSITPGLNTSEDQEGDVFNYATMRYAQSHALGSFRIGYGANLALGTYLLTASNSGGFEVDDAYRDAQAGTRFFGAAGINTKMSFTTSSRDGRKEWRFLGLEGSVYREFGDFIKTRQNFPEGTSTLVERSEWTYTAGLFTEAVFKKKNDKYFGFKFGLSLRTLPRLFTVVDPYKDDDNTDELPRLPDYFNATFMGGKGHGHMYIQPGFGKNSFSLQVGFLYKIY